MTSKFSVIIPTRNRPEFLLEAVQSVLQQSHRDLELLIVNDGDEISCPVEDSRLRILNNQKRGAVAARNFGVAEATGAFIAFLDDDDFWIDMDHLKKSSAALQKQSDFYFADGDMIFADGKIKAFAQHATAATLEHDNTILISAVCYSRLIHAQLGHFDEALPYYWDWDWYIRVSRGGFKFYHQKTPAVRIRVHAQNMSGGNDHLRRANLDAMIAKHRLGAIPLKNHTDFV
jgi:glycosyltransferase involved in cell wall biosynthesis